MRGKLILLFVVIKVIPLLLLAALAWHQISRLGTDLGGEFSRLGKTVEEALTTISETAVTDSVRALDDRARIDIERITTDTAMAVARFLYERDADIRYISQLSPSTRDYQTFIRSRQSLLPIKENWHLSADGSHWQADTDTTEAPPPEFHLRDNARELNYRQPEVIHRKAPVPLYREITFVDLNGQEQIRILGDGTISKQLRKVANPDNTFVKAETYFRELASLGPQDIYVSDVIGAYVGSQVIGAYTPASAARAGIPFEPANSAYAGRENPLGKTFEGLVRWAMPVFSQGKKTGYVTLALDHRHLMAFTDHIMPTNDRYTATADATNGNYAFMWDYLGRSIAHPRHYFITGYNPDNGLPAVPWLTDQTWNRWQNSGLPFNEFVRELPTFDDQGLHQKPSKQQIAAGQLGLDCRYLDFAPQCTGWMDVTSQGGSGSFVILWSGIWKLTTAAPIPYFTGRYGHSPRGFGFVTIGANVDEFHHAANLTRESIATQVSASRAEIADHADSAVAAIRATLRATASSLSLSTITMSVLVVMIAIWMAYYLSSYIRDLIAGISRFQQGEHEFRFNTTDTDEIGALANAFDGMADHIEHNIHSLESEIRQRQQTETLLRKMQDQLETLVEERTAELRTTNAELQIQIEERRLAESRVRHLAEHDPLTGLANRLKFQRQLDLALREAQAEGHMVALLFFDLDRFKQVNDTLGHTIGDKLLNQVAQTLRQFVRLSDTVARLGGDEFAIIMGGLSNLNTAEKVASRILETLTLPIRIDGHSIQTGTSIGIASYPDGSSDSSSLIIHADQAMYQAKKQGGQCFRHYQSANPDL